MSGSWHPPLETSKEIEALAQSISDSHLQLIHLCTAVLLSLEVGEQGKMLLVPFNSHREREQKRGKLDTSQTDSERQAPSFSSCGLNFLEWEQRVRRGDCYVKNRFDSHTLSPFFVPLTPSPWGEEGENYTNSSAIPGYGQTSYNIWISQPWRQKWGRLFWGLKLSSLQDFSDKCLLGDKC